MILGVVNPSREATIRLQVSGPGCVPQEVEAVIDTGFDGWMSLPPAVIAVLALPWRTRGRAILANGSEDEFDVHSGSVLWNGVPRRIPIEAADTDPLVGMSLLYGSDLMIRGVDGGRVQIEPIP